MVLYLSSFTNVTASISSFQLERKVNIATVARAGDSKGSIMLKNILYKKFYIFTDISHSDINIYHMILRVSYSMSAFKAQTKHKNLVLPKYLQIKHMIKSEIEKRILPAGHQLLPLRDMAGRFGVSYLTMHQAIAALENDGLVKSIHGKGVFVSENLPNIPIAEMKKAKVVTRISGEEGDYQWNLLHIIEQKLREDNTEMVFMPAHWDAIERIPDDETDCYYFIAPPEYALPGLQQLSASGCRFAVIGASWAGQEDLFCVDSDNYNAARKAV
jgi:DNA-binding transcriptional regulator YhcF (GntR family)